MRVVIASGHVRTPVALRCKTHIALMRCAGAEDPAPTPPRPAAIALPPLSPMPVAQRDSRPAAVIAPDDNPVPNPSTLSGGGVMHSPGLRGCTDCELADSEGFAGSPGSGSASGPLPRPPTLQQAIAERLVSEAHARGSTDNLAAVVVDLGLGSVAGPRQAANPRSSAGGRPRSDPAQPHGGPDKLEYMAAVARGQGPGSEGVACERNGAAAVAVKHAVATLGPSSLIARPCGANPSAAL